MPLIECPDCHHEISDSAPACIHCGRPRQSSTSGGRPSSSSTENREGEDSRGDHSSAPGPTVKEERDWKDWLAGAVAFAAGYLLFRLPTDSLELKFLAGGIAGLLVGLVPFYLAQRRDAGTFAVVSLVSCTLVGVAGGLVLAGPLCVILALYIRRRPLVMSGDDAVSS